MTRLLAAGATIAARRSARTSASPAARHTAVTGPVHNPWDPSHNTGGSSSGSGALVAAGEVDLAIGGDQGGSVRMPAANCGLVGHKPTWGLVPYTGAFPIEATIDHLGPITRTVADAALMLAVMAGPDGLDPRQPRDRVRRTTSRRCPGRPGLRVGVRRGLRPPGVRGGRRRDGAQRDRRLPAPG